MKNQHTGNKSIDLYRRLTLLILFVLFVIFTLVVIIIYSVGGTDTSTWIGKVQQFILNLYPNLFIIPFTFLFGYLFFGPIQKADQEAQEKQFLEKMANVFLPTLEENFIEKVNEALVPTIQTSLANMLQVSGSLQEMGIIGAKPRIEYTELMGHIAQSKERVYFSDTWFYYAIREFETAFKQTDLHQVPLRILLLDPKSPVGKQRLADIYHEHGQLESISKLTVANITSLFKKLHLGNLELRFHSTMPALQIYIYDNEATVGFYFHGKDSMIFTQLEVLIKDKKGQYTPFGKLIEEDFEKRWSLATPVPL
jgi:hypothetical protein